MALKVFVDTDVVISSLISSTGAASILLTQTKDIELVISNISQKEIEKVSERLGLENKKTKDLIKKLSIIKLKKTKDLEPKFDDYVLDPNDAHIVKGGKQGKAKFIISYNIKHFKTEKIKEDFNITLTTPAKLLQYSRSL